MDQIASPRRRQLSACVIAFNEEDRIGACLESLAWCDEIVVVDCHSDDGTRELAQQAGAKVIERDWPGYSAQKNFAVDSAANDWVLCVDADERVSPQLRDEIVSRLESAREAAGWDMPRLSRYLGAWIRHGTWYPDRQLRLFDRRRGRWASRDAYDVHERVRLDARSVAHLHRPLLHDPYRTLGEHLRTIDRYTTIIAAGLHAAGRRAGPLQLVLRPFGGFLRFYLLKRGFLDGWRGLLLAYMHAHYVRMKYAKLLALGKAEVGGDRERGD